MKKYLLLLIAVAAFMISGCYKPTELTQVSGDKIIIENWLFGWGCLSMVVSTLAQSLNRNGLSWFVFALITGPLALFFLMMLGKDENS